MIADRRSGGRDRTLIWLACLFALAAGTYVGWFRLGAQIDDQLEMRAQVASNERIDAAILATRPQLEQTEGELDAEVARLQLRADRPTAVARFIRTAAHLADVHKTRLVQIDERPAIASARPAQTGATPAPFETIGLDVTLSGSYRDLLATIRDLAQAPIAMHIEITAIERSAGDRATLAVPLTARLHVDLQRPRPPEPSSVSPVDGGP